MLLTDWARRKIYDILLNQLKTKIEEYQEADDMEKPFYNKLIKSKIIIKALDFY